MGGAERQNRPSSIVLKPPSQAASVSSTGEPPVARVTLPSNLSGSLKYLDDAQLERLLEAVTVEIDRRNHGAAKNEGASGRLLTFWHPRLLTVMPAEAGIQSGGIRRLQPPVQARGRLWTPAFAGATRKARESSVWLLPLRCGGRDVSESPICTSF